MTPALRRAIKLREWTRVACDGGDIREIARLNQLADRAVAVLSPEEMSAYTTWVWSGPAGEKAWDELFGAKGILR